MWNEFKSDRNVKDVDDFLNFMSSRLNPSLISMFRLPKFVILQND
jgi:hypothetical protein